MNYQTENMQHAQDLLKSLYIVLKIWVGVHVVQQNIIYHGKYEIVLTRE